MNDEPLIGDVAGYTDTVIGDPAVQIAVVDCIACMRAGQTADPLTTAQAMVELELGLMPSFLDEMAYIRERQAQSGNKWFGALRLLELERDITESRTRRLLLGLEARLLDVATLAAFDFACWRQGQRQ